jgi:hypothetical protein
MTGLITLILELLKVAMTGQSILTPMYINVKIVAIGLSIYLCGK